MIWKWQRLSFRMVLWHTLVPLIGLVVVWLRIGQDPLLSNLQRNRIKRESTKENYAEIESQLSLI